jgi:hypothetical protein
MPFIQDRNDTPSRLEILYGKKFGRLFITSEYRRLKTKKSSRTQWFCLCSCGESVWVDSTKLKNNHTKSCGCLRIEECKKRTKKDYMSFKFQIFNTYKKDANKRNLSFELSFEDFCNYICSNCFYCDAEPSNKMKIKKRYFYYSGIDRVNNLNGYNLDNCVSCCRCCNISKRDMSIEKFVLWINRLYKNVKFNISDINKFMS